MINNGALAEIAALERNGALARMRQRTRAPCCAPTASAPSPKPPADKTRCAKPQQRSSPKPSATPNDSKPGYDTKPNLHSSLDEPFDDNINPSLQHNKTLCINQSVPTPRSRRFRSPKRQTTPKPNEPSQNHTSNAPNQNPKTQKPQTPKTLKSSQALKIRKI